MLAPLPLAMIHQEVEQPGGRSESPTSMYGAQIVPHEDGVLPPMLLDDASLDDAELNPTLTFDFGCFASDELSTASAGAFARSSSDVTTTSELDVQSPVDLMFIKSELQDEIQYAHYLPDQELAEPEPKHCTIKKEHEDNYEQPAQTVETRACRHRTKRKASPYSYSPSPPSSPPPSRILKARKVDHEYSYRTSFNEGENLTPQQGKALVRLLRMFPKEILRSSPSQWKSTKGLVGSLSSADQKTIATLRRKELSCVYAEKARQTRIRDIKNYAQTVSGLKVENRELKEDNQALREQLAELKTRVANRI